MNWYMQTGKDGDVVLSSKINYSRNLRISIKDYHNSMKKLRPICHFESNDKKMAQILRFRDSAVDIKNKYGGKTIHFDKNYKVKKMSA